MRRIKGPGYDLINEFMDVAEKAAKTGQVHVAKKAHEDCVKLVQELNGMADHMTGGVVTTGTNWANPKGAAVVNTGDSKRSLKERSKYAAQAAKEIEKTRKKWGMW